MSQSAEAKALGGAFWAAATVALTLGVWAAGYGGLRYAFEGLMAFAGYDWPDTMRQHQTRLALELVELDHRLANAGARSKEDLGHLRARREDTAAELAQVRTAEPLPEGVAKVAKVVIVGLPPVVMMAGALWVIAAALREEREKALARRKSEDPEEQKRRMDLLVERWVALNPGKVPPGVEQHLAERRGEPPLLPDDAFELVAAEPPRPAEVKRSGPIAPRGAAHALVTRDDPLPLIPKVRDENGLVWTILCDGQRPPPVPKRGAKSAGERAAARTATPIAVKHEVRRNDASEQPAARVTIAGAWRERPEHSEPAHWSDPPEDPTEWPMTAAAWSVWTDARDLLRHAVPRLPAQHLSVVLAELAERAWPAWHAAYPDDWRPAWCIATLRAWCFGEASVGEVLRAREAVVEAGMERRGGRVPGSEANAARAACDAAMMATAYLEAMDPEERSSDAALGALDRFVDAMPGAAEQAVALALRVSDASGTAMGKAYAAFRWDEDQERSQRDHDAAGYERAAKIIRELVPYREDASTRWEVVGGVVVIEGAEIVIEGWKAARFEEQKSRGSGARPAASSPS